MRLIFAFSVLALASLRADSLTDLKATLTNLKGESPISALIQYSFWEHSGDGPVDAAPSGIATALVEENQNGLRTTWDRAHIERLKEEASTRAISPEKKTPTQNGMNRLSLNMQRDYLNIAPPMIQLLSNATLLEEKNDTYAGQPCKCVRVKLDPKMSAKNRKFIKEMDVTATIWIGPTGTPIAAERETKFKGRAYIVITFDSSDKEHYDFTLVNDRLVASKYAKEARGSGAGESNTSKTEVSVTLSQL